MYLKLFTILLVAIVSLSANELSSNYYVTSNYIKVSDITNNPLDEDTLFTIEANRHSKRVKTSKLLKILKKHNISNYKSKHNYIQFTKKSPISTEKIEEYVEAYYKKNYLDIDINNIIIEPRSYISAIPDNYSVFLRKNAHLSNTGTLHIKTDDNKKIFFNYKIDAKISLYVSKQDIKKDEELSNLNTKKALIKLEKMKSNPIENIKKGMFQAKHNIKKMTSLTDRDAVGLNLISRGSKVSVTLKNSSMAISFIAISNKNGKYGESIYVTNKKGNKIKVIVTGRNRAEIRE